MKAWDCGLRTAGLGAWGTGPQDVQVVCQTPAVFHERSQTAAITAGAAARERPGNRVVRDQMYVAAAKISLHIPSSQSLKDRRRVLRSLMDRTRNRFGAAVAEVDGQETWQLAGIGVSVVSSSESHAREMLDSVVRFIEEFSPEALVTGVESDIIPFES